METEPSAGTFDRSILVPYGSTVIKATIPKKNFAFLIEPADYPPVHDVSEEVRRSSASPIGCPPIRELAKKSGKVVIAVDDLTRITPVKQILPPLIEELRKAGVRDEEMKVMIALGTHRKMSNEEIRARFGDEIVNSIQVENHDSGAKEKLIYAQTTRSGYPIWINRDFAEADLKIGVGTVQPHDIAGWSGGSKILLPGLAGEETTNLMHLLGGYLPLEKRLGKAETPVRAEMDSVARKVGLDLIVNCVLNVQKQVVKIFCGDAVKAHREAVRFAEPIFCPRIPKKADIVVASSHPADLDYWQALKGVAAGSQTLKKGGTLILVTPCPEGVAGTHPQFEEFAKLTVNEIKTKVRRKEFRDLAAAGILMDHARCRAKFNLIFVSEGLDDQTCERLGVRKINTLDQAIRVAREEKGSNAKIGFVTHSDLAPSL